MSTTLFEDGCWDQDEFLRLEKKSEHYAFLVVLILLIYPVITNGFILCNMK